MTDAELERDDDDVAQMAVRALTAASRRAIESGRPVIFVVDDQLVRRDASGTTVVGQLPPRRKVSDRIKQASK
jgi:CO dehydrogenase/acetyl-CoA synthase alpha subunit